MLLDSAQYERGLIELTAGRVDLLSVPPGTRGGGDRESTNAKNCGRAGGLGNLVFTAEAKGGKVIMGEEIFFCGCHLLRIAILCR